MCSKYTVGNLQHLTSVVTAFLQCLKNIQVGYTILHTTFEQHFGSVAAASKILLYPSGKSETPWISSTELGSSPPPPPSPEVLGTASDIILVSFYDNLKNCVKFAKIKKVKPKIYQRMTIWYPWVNHQKHTFYNP